MQKKRYLWGNGRSSNIFFEAKIWTGSPDCLWGKKMKVLYITNIPSPYKVDFYNELGKYCELTALFETDASTERSEEWKKYCFD